MILSEYYMLRSDGVVLFRTYSTKGMMIERDGVRYDEAIDPVDTNREYVETDEPIEIPEPESANAYSGQFKLRIPKSLHKALAERSKAEGIRMNQYCLYLLARNDALYPKV